MDARDKAILGKIFYDKYAETQWKLAEDDTHYARVKNQHNWNEWKKFYVNRDLFHKWIKTGVLVEYGHVEIDHNLTCVEKDHAPTHALPESAAYLLAIDALNEFDPENETLERIQARIEARLSMWQCVSLHFKKGERVTWRELFETLVTVDCPTGDEMVALLWPEGGQFWVPVGEVELL